MTRKILVLSVAILLCFLCPHVTIASGGGQKTKSQLWKECEKARILSNYNALEKLSNQLMSISVEDNDKRMQSYALFYRGLSQLFSGKAKNSLSTFDKAKSIAEEIENDSVQALVMNAVGIYHAMVENNSFMAQQYFFKGIKLANNSGYNSLKSRIYGNMLILTQSDRDTTALGNAFRIYNYGKREGDYEQTFMGAYYLAMYYNLRSDNENAEHYIKESLELYRKYDYDDVSAVYTLLSKIKADEGKLDEATLHATTAIRLAREKNQPQLVPDAYTQYATILNEQGKYAESNRVARMALDASKDVSIHTKRVTCMRLIADNCKHLGLKDEAIEYLVKANLMMDTLSRINMDRLMHERTIMLDIEQKEREAVIHKKEMESQLKINVTLAVTTMILIVLLSIIVANYRRRNRLYKNIVKQNTRALAYQAQLQQRIDSLNSRIAVQAKPSSGMVGQGGQTQDNKTFNDLYERACQMMEDERLYADSQLNRERLAELLGTNRTYLSRIIKENSGMNYIQFVNSYRIQEAIHILSDRSKIDYPLKQIWCDLGFNSPATFYKIFQQTVGMTPSVYRKQFINVEKEMSETS
ncbi:MAG: AraC family transcriptional regulator [Prevotella sp.]|uniref:helix-turn-helix domain-containing protein n=1 Tax=Prevotella sp. TaxID=59823 RepID=UPI002A301E51|nr:helix-turn-helix domain-containing protein [Prevotella sp.]MDD7318421.1 AraC family transcriptional regulator [Prevotellaceae bacterium]MDY4020228.1 AraC family transcriptional regulator [Prevotella sp.]